MTKHEITMVAEARVELARVTKDVRQTVTGGEYVTEEQRDALDFVRRRWYMAIEAALMVCEDDNGSSALLLTVAPPSEIVKAAKRIALGRPLNPQVAVGKQT